MTLTAPASLDADQTRARLAAWLESRIPGAAAVEVGELQPTSAGFSARTLMFTAAYDHDGARRERELVMRRELPGHPIFLDTNLRHQGEVMLALTRHGVPTTPLVGMEDDEAVLGARFLVTDRVAGKPFPAANYNVGGWMFELPVEARGRLWTNAVEMLGRVNRLDWRRGFTMLDKPQYGPPGLDQYLGWLRAWRAQSGGGAPHPVIDPAMDYLERAKPKTARVDPIWGDSNPGNMLFADDHSVAAVLDFEAAALGPGEIDLGWWLFMDERRSHGLTRLAGLPDRKQMIAAYEAAIGRPVDDMHYYEVLGGVRMSLVIVRTTDRLVEMGRLPADTTAPLHNPIAACLGRKIGLDPPDGGEAFAEFGRAVSQR